MYDTFVRREISDELAQRKISVIAALHANSNYAGEDGASLLRDQINDVEKGFDRAIELVNMTAEELASIEDEEDEAMNSDFMRPIRLKLEQEKRRGEIASPADGSLRNVVNAKVDVDQL